MAKLSSLLLGLGQVSHHSMVKNENFLGNGHDQGGQRFLSLTWVMTVSCFQWAHTTHDVKPWLSVTKAVSMYNEEPKKPNKTTKQTNTKGLPTYMCTY